MFNFTKSFMAVALAAASVGATAQDYLNKADLFGQDQSSQSDADDNAPNPGSNGMNSMTNGVNLGANGSRRVIIANTPTGQAAAAAAARAASSGGNGNGSNNGVGFNNNNNFNNGNGTGQQSVLGNRIGEKSPELSEFQKFIADNTGQYLPIFGSGFFANGSSTFAPIVNSPVPSDYPLGPGDELMIRGWGTIDIDYRATVDRNGTINIPTIGSVVLAGVKAGNAENVIRAAVAKLYKGVTISVNFGQLRAITVYVVGQASRPGTYTVSSLSTLVTALFASGGPNANGSMRRVQVKRNGKVAAELDLYSFIAKGDKSADIKLLDGDTIYIPPAGGFVALVGKVNSPAIYELKSGKETVESMLDFAGGLPVVADPRRAFLERIDPNKNRPRSVEEFALSGEGLKRSLKTGDVLSVTSITPDFSNAVVLRGNVDQPVRAPFKQGMRISDLIPSREYLITRDSIKRQNNTVAPGNDEKDTTEDANKIAARIGGLIDAINWDYAVVERVNRSDLSVQLVPFNLGNVFANPNGPDNLLLQPGDTVTIFSQSDVAVPMNKRQVFVRVEGEVKVPGVYQMTASDTLQTLIAKAGGPTSNAYMFGTAFYREEVRKEQQANLKRAADRLEAQLRSEESTQAANLRALSGTDAAAAAAQLETERKIAQERLVRFRNLQPSGRIAFGLDPNDRSFAHLPQVTLKNGDRLVVPSKPAFVHVFGAVNVEASPLWKPNTRVNDYLKVAGTAVDADIDNVFVLRVDGTVVSSDSQGWFFGKIGGVEIMPGDTIVVPEKFDRQTAWSKFTQGAREWTQILANFGLGAAAVKTLRD
ncbi:SLBB domain-containing protein [Massilia sp. Root133]|uniref:polysaccharide biosynthesis/export family protein n=1 Tax=Massilia sp. Root133 TaxID=1736455 RepID=UPI001E294B67|nr:SLBB domain-containing protein [Massilia sp. Root133]